VRLDLARPLARAVDRHGQAVPRRARARMGDDEQAGDLEAALAHARASDDYEALADTLHMRCKSGIDSGRFDAADGWCRQGLALRESIYPADHPSIGASLLALARVHAGRRDFDGAVVLDRRAYTLLQKTLGNDHPYLGNIQLNTGVDLVAAARYEEAEPHYAEAIRIALAARGADHPITLLAQNNLANLSYLRGDYARSLELHEAIAARRAASLPPAHSDRAQSENNIARALWRLHRPDEAAEHWRRALAIYADGGAPRSSSRGGRIGHAVLALERGDAGAALVSARELQKEIEAERPDLDGLGACLFLEARALSPRAPRAPEAVAAANRALAVLANEDRTRYLAQPAEIERWLDARP
jgi:tetratricopeptide (TPR) repeat protein